jgi:aspartyl protease family protein
MGIQDRDYYREKINKKSTVENTSFSPKRTHHCLKKTTNKKIGLQYPLYSLVILMSLWYCTDTLVHKMRYGKATDTANSHGISGQPTNIMEHESDRQNPLSGDQSSTDLIPGGLVLKKDRSGHFLGTAMINGVEMPFMVDTGASSTVIPYSMAMSAGLPIGRAVPVNTAGGQVFEQETRIDTIRIGTAEIRNLDARISRYLDEVLIGMNTLRYFRMTQDGDNLTLVVTHYPDKLTKLENVRPAPTHKVRSPNRETRKSNNEGDEPLRARDTWKKRLSVAVVMKSVELFTALTDFRQELPAVHPHRPSMHR